MKKNILLWLLLFMVPVICLGEKDYCKKIKKSTDNGATTYKSPALKSATLIKQIKSDTVFSLHIHFRDANQHFDTEGAEIEFEDGTVLKDEHVRVHCIQELSALNNASNSASTFAGEYLLQGFFSITDDNIATFIAKKIVRVRLHTVSKSVGGKDATAIINYIMCMYDLK